MGYSCNCETTWHTVWTATVLEMKPKTDCVAEILEKGIIAEQEIRNKDYVKYDAVEEVIRESYFQVTPTGGSWNWRNVKVVKNCFNSNFIKHNNVKFELDDYQLLAETTTWTPSDYLTPRAGTPLDIRTYCSVNGSWIRVDACRLTDNGTPGEAYEYRDRILLRYNPQAFTYEVNVQGDLSWDECTPGNPKCVRAPQTPSNLNCTKKEEWVQLGTVACTMESFYSQAYLRADWLQSHDC